MEKENGEGGDGGKPPPDGMLDPSGLFGAYWGRDAASATGSAAAAAQAQAQAALFGFGGRYPPPTTLGVAANQAASLGLHPAASAAWWSMASHLAAQDYLHRLQASGLNFPPMGDPYSAMSALTGLGMKQPPKAQSKSSKGNDRSGRSSASSSSAPSKEKSPATSTPSPHPSMRSSSYGFPKSLSPSSHHAQVSMSSLASLNNMVSSHQSKASSMGHSKPSTSHSSASRKQSSSASSTASSKDMKNRSLDLLRGDLMLAQAAAQGAYHAAVAAAAKGKNMSSLYPFGMPGTDNKGRHTLDSLAGLPHNILSDPASVLGGVRLPPDTEIIKYTSSLAGPKAPPGTTNRGRKKTISLDPPSVSVHPASADRSTPLPNKRPKVDDYNRSSVEVIRLPNRDRMSAGLTETPPPNLSDYAGISRELLQTIASQSGVSLAAVETQLAGTVAAHHQGSGMNLSKKSSHKESMELGHKSSSGADEDAPLNLSLKPAPPSNKASDALSCLTSLSSSLSASHNDRISRRKPGAKPRRVMPEMNPNVTESPRPKSSGSEDSESVCSWASREARPRNLGRGVSKPKKNTVASLLAQSRALGLRPALAQQLLAETDLEKLKALLGEAVSTDSECLSESAASDSDSDNQNQNHHNTRLPLRLGWKRTTLIRGLSRSCNIKGDVTYTPPEPHSSIKLRSAHELQNYLDSNPSPSLTLDNFSFSARLVLGDYVQASTEPNGEPFTCDEEEITKRLEEARALAALTGPRPTPPPVDRRLEVARRQQAARDARRDAHTFRTRDQARLVRDLERNERAEVVKRDKEARSQQLLEEREIKRQQAMLLKEQERERRRQHTSLIRQLDVRRRWEARERRKHQNLLDRLLVKEVKLQQRRKEMELLAELRRPQEDSTLSDHSTMPVLSRIPGLKLPGEAMAYLLQVVEFLHNFGRTLGFDVDNLPTLNSFQMGLLPDCSIDDEQEVLQILTQLLVCAIEDPGIPHPGRHTTLLGHAIRMGDITDDNISEVLRIYLYANATGEVKALTGLSVERERERRIPDHHQTDIEMQQATLNTKNLIYYEHLHSNSTYKLSEHLRDKPFLALNPTIKAKILAYLCDELLQNKAVLRQIDAGLDNLNQLKKERYLMDMKIRKFRVMCQRKMRAEQTEKQQALALERMQKMVDESGTYSGSLQANDEEQSSEKTDRTDQKEQDSETAVHSESEREKETTISDPTPSPKGRHDDELSPKALSPKELSPKELSPLKEVPNSMKTKGLMNNNKDEGSPVENSKDKDSVMGDCDAGLSDLESEGTQPDEEEDKSLTAEELGRKLDRLLRQSETQLQQLAAAQHALRPTQLGQDRYWRRYWSLGKCGGIFVEAMESAQPEIMAYHQRLQAQAELTMGSTKRASVKGTKDKKETTETDQAIDAGAEALKCELELKNIKSELNLSDHTQIIKYEANVKSNTCKTSGSSIKMEEKFIQHKQLNEQQDMLDIEDSIPTAFLVQKPSHNPLYAGQPEAVAKPQEILKVENLLKNEITEPKPEPEDVKDDLVNNLEELRKMAEAVSSQLEAAKIEEEKVKQEQKVVKNEQDSKSAHDILYQKIVEGKWFSILRHENSILNNINETQEKLDIPVYIDNEHTCAEIVTVQGHKWDVSNNLHLLKDPSIFTLNSMVTAVQVPTNNIYLDSCLTTSGLDQDLIDSASQNSLITEEVAETSDSKTNDEKLDDLEKELHSDDLKTESIQKAKANNLISLGILNFNALSTYVTCDSPPPIQMTSEEIEQLEHCKVNGLPKKIEGNFVPKELRHGWWRITEPEQLRSVLDALHPRGVRERELAASIQQIPTINNKLYIDPGDTQYTELQTSHLDRVISQNGGYPSPDAPSSFSAVTARRKDIKVLNMVEQLEERVAAASMQTKGWRTSRAALPDEANGAEIVARARNKLASLEAHIERRYLKPPLVQRYSNSAEASLGAAMQAEHGNCSASSPHNSDNSETKEKGVSRSLAAWREAVSRCNTSAQLAQVANALESHVAWDKSIMKANCQFCLSGDNEDQLLLCDGCDKGYHTYCFKPRMDKIPEGDWYCWECVNKARGDKVCIVCGGVQIGRTIPCSLCPRAYHQQCHYPPLPKNPRGKWYCVNCISRAPPKKPRNSKKRDSKGNPKDIASNADDMVPSPAASHASTSTTAEEFPSMQQTPEKMHPDHENGLPHSGAAGDLSEAESVTPDKKISSHYGGNGALGNDLHSNEGEPMDTEELETPPSRHLKERNSTKRQQKELDFCKSLLCEMECHEHAWPFLLPVNTKQFPQYKKVIRSPMDLSTIKKKLHDNSYKSKDDFANDVRLIFSNCELFNEDDSPVGRAGHSMRQFFQTKWSQYSS